MFFRNVIESSKLLNRNIKTLFKNNSAFLSKLTSSSLPASSNILANSAIHQLKSLPILQIRCPFPNERQKQIIDNFPISNDIQEKPLPLSDIQEIIDKLHESRIDSIELPTSGGTVNEIHAAVLIKIRRKKMKKHKLKKLRKKMKFEWAKLRHRRAMKKEKIFQAELLALVKEAEQFSAEAYVDEKLRQANEKQRSLNWKYTRIPDFTIKQKLGIK